MQRSRIECRAPASIQDGVDGPPIDRRGNYTGPSNSWSISETHSILDISVFESGCEETRNETLIEVLGPTPRHFPGDRDIEDTQSPLLDLYLQTRGVRWISKSTITTATISPVAASYSDG